MRICSSELVDRASSFKSRKAEAWRTITTRLVSANTACVGKQPIVSDVRASFSGLDLDSVLRVISTILFKSTGV
jgi:hypothetical protein